MIEFTRPTAAEEYAVRLATRERSPVLRVAHRVWGVASTLVNGAVGDGLLPYPETGEILVTDRDDVTVLRLPTSLDTVDATLEQLETDLSALSAEEFLAQWLATN